jgi:hypothetical protein
VNISLSFWCFDLNFFSKDILWKSLQNPMKITLQKDNLKRSVTCLVRRRKIISFVKKTYLWNQTFLECSNVDQIWFSSYSFRRVVFIGFCREFHRLSSEKKLSLNMKNWEKYSQNTKWLILCIERVKNIIDKFFSILPLMQHFLRADSSWVPFPLNHSFDDSPQKYLMSAYSSLNTGKIKRKEKWGWNLWNILYMGQIRRKANWNGYIIWWTVMPRSTWTDYKRQ